MLVLVFSGAPVVQSSFEDFVSYAALRPMLNVFLTHAACSLMSGCFVLLP